MRFSSAWWVVALCGCLHAPPASTKAEVTTLDGAPVAFDDAVSRAPATVVVFFSTTCPCVMRYQRRVEAVADAYAAKGVHVVYVSSNADDAAPTLKGAVRERGLKRPLWVDWSGSFAQRLGVRTTPTVVVLDPSGQIQFRGWLDNEHDVGTAGREAWLEEALDDVLAGRAVRQPASPTFGCAITRSLGAGRVCPAPPQAEPTPSSLAAPAPGR